MTKETISTLDEIQKKWSNITSSIDNFPSDNNETFLPIAKRIFAKIIGEDMVGGYWVKSKVQQLRESRLNKLRQLQGEEPNIILPDDEFIKGIKPVPLSAPIGQIFYTDFKYESNEQIEKKEKIINIIESLKNNIYSKNKLNHG